MDARTILPPLALCLLLVLSGCAEGAYVGQRHARYETPYNNVGLTSRTLSRVLAVEESNSNRSATNTLEVWAQLRNRSNVAFPVTARTTFYAADRRPLETTGWTTLFLDPLSMATYTTVSTRSDAVFYYVEVREGGL